MFYHQVSRRGRLLHDEYGGMNGQMRSWLGRREIGSDR